ncbi:MAG: transglycosylase domain-containing protein [Hyphomicrobiales bacterium]|nr:transglycosylase domain-containing protein [Hyphomicrobiales bacterium]
MDSLLVKIFATALTFSQVTVGPDTIKTEFDPIQDQHEVVAMLRAGCAHMRKAFDIEDINIDDLIATAMDDPEAVSGSLPQFRGLNLGHLHIAYRQFCKGETVPNSPVDIAHVIEFYNRAVANLPDHGRLRGMRLPGVSTLLDGRGQKFAEVFEQDQRRVWVPLAEIPAHVQAAFIAAEDKRFHEHRGIDERALIRAFIGNLTQTGRPQGGSTITQQLIKNLLVGDDLSYERKMREMILAARAERLLTKGEILELYLNSVYLGRSSWGIELAARSYFGKPTSALTLGEGALLAGLTKGPNFFNPDRHPERVRERFAYVLGRMAEDSAINGDLMKRTVAGGVPALVAFERPRRDIGFHFTDQVARDARTIAGVEGLTAQTYTVRSTIIPPLQRAAEAALQDGLARYEAATGRAQGSAAEANLGEAIRRIEAQGGSGGRPAWQQALVNARLPLYDVHWPQAVVVDERAGNVRVGLADGRVVPLSGGRNTLRSLKVHDAVYVRIAETKGAKGKAGSVRAELRQRPTVQGAVVVLENKTGRILAMVGGFSYPLSQLNRVTQSQRQPGSAIKPVSYLAALAQGLQPNTLVRDEPLTLPPIGGATARTRPEDYWSPRNYDGGGSGIMTMRRALEFSRNLATAYLLHGIDITPALSLDRICALSMEAQIYRDCARYYPFVLGAQPVRPLDLAAFFAAIANEGVRPTPHTIESIEQDGRVIYRHPAAEASTRIASADGVAFFQLKTMLQGVLQRGTATRIAGLAPYVAGKTGTTDNENDAWFVGFTNEVTVAVWVGYDNADGRRRTLGSGATGGSVAVPIFEPVMQAVWAHYAPRTVLRGPTPETRKFLVATRVDADALDIMRDGPDGRDGRGEGRPATLVEYLRRDSRGQPIDTQHRLISRDETLDIVGRRDDRGVFDFFFGGGRGFAPGGARGGFAPWGAPYPPPQPPAYGLNAPRPTYRPLWRGDPN